MVWKDSSSFPVAGTSGRGSYLGRSFLESLGRREWWPKDVVCVSRSKLAVDYRSFFGLVFKV